MLAQQEEVIRAQERAEEEAAARHLREAQKQEAQAAASQLALIFEGSREATASTHSTPAGIASPNPFKPGSAVPEPPIAPLAAATNTRANRTKEAPTPIDVAAAATGTSVTQASEPWSHLSPERLVKLRRLRKLRGLLQNLPPGVELAHNPALAVEDAAADSVHARRSTRRAGSEQQQPADAIAILASVACM